MPRNIAAYLAPCVVLLAAAPALGQQAGPPAAHAPTETANPGSQQGPVGAPDGPRPARLTTSTTPDTPESTAHKQTAMRLAAGDAVLTKAYNFTCTPTRYNDPGVDLAPAKVFDNLYAIPSSAMQQTMVCCIAELGMA